GRTQRMIRTMIRGTLAKSGGAWNGIPWRAHEVTRIEALSDAVFAFAVALLIVSLEVPETWNDLWAKNFCPKIVPGLRNFERDDQQRYRESEDGVAEGFDAGDFVGAPGNAIPRSAGLCECAPNHGSYHPLRPP